MIPGQLTGPGVNFASVHGLTPVTVHMSYAMPRDKSSHGFRMLIINVWNKLSYK